MSPNTVHVHVHHTTGSGVQLLRHVFFQTTPPRSSSISRLIALHFGTPYSIHAYCFPPTPMTVCLHTSCTFLSLPLSLPLSPSSSSSCTLPRPLLLLNTLPQSSRFTPCFRSPANLHPPFFTTDHPSGRQYCTYSMSNTIWSHAFFCLNPASLRFFPLLPTFSPIVLALSFLSSNISPISHSYLPIPIQISFTYLRPFRSFFNVIWIWTMF